MRKEARLLLTLAPSLGLRRRSLSGAAETQDEGQTSKTVRPSFSPLPSVRNFPRCFKISSFCPLNSAPKRAIHIGCKSAKAGHRQTALGQLGKGNPMKDHARHVLGSTQSRHTPLRVNATPARRFETVSEKSVQNPYKSDHFRICEFFNASASTTYNFNALKCTDFPVARLVGRRSADLRLGAGRPPSSPRRGPGVSSPSGRGLGSRTTWYISVRATPLATEVSILYKTR